MPMAPTTTRWPIEAPAAPELEVQRCEQPADLEIVAEGLAFPEGPIACADGSVLLVEVRGGRLTRVLPTGRHEVVAELGGGPNGAAIGPDGAVYVCNNGGLPWTRLADGSWYPVEGVTGSMTPADYDGGWIERVDLATGEARRIVEQFDGSPLSAPNDIAFDERGRMWFTDTGKTDTDHTALGAVYRARIDGSELAQLAKGPLGPNGIGFSTNGTHLYVADTPTGRILEWDVTSDQLPANPRAHGALVRGRLPGSIAVDSLAVDSEDRVIVALPGARALGVIQPDGGVWLVEMPDPLPTNICFGGPDNTTAFVTLGGHGRLASFRWPCPGAALPFST